MTEKQRRQYYRFETRAGECLLVYVRQPFQAIRLFLPGGVSETALSIAECQGAVEGPVATVAGFVQHYFAGDISDPPSRDLLLMDQLTAKEQALLRAVADIPYGMTRTYGEVAATAGFSDAARFAGNTLAKNPFPVIIPCHRVIRADGTPGGFGAGTRLKAAMLKLEERIFPLG